MFKIKKKNLVYFGPLAFLFLILVSLISAFKSPVLETARYPFSLLSLIRREVRGIIFYRRNFTQNERLKKEVDFLRQKLNTQEELKLENTRLKNILSLKDKSPYKVIAARVIGHSADNWSSCVILNKGRHHGVRNGCIIINYLGLVGRVMETTLTTSIVMLINDPNSGVSGIVQRSRQEGLVCGTLGNSLLMKYLPKESDIQVSDTIITSGLTAMYPKGLLIGKVTDIGSEFSGLSRYAIIKPAVELANLEEVLVIMP